MHVDPPLIIMSLDGAAGKQKVAGLVAPMEDRVPDVDRPEVIAQLDPLVAKLRDRARGPLRDLLPITIVAAQLATKALVQLLVQLSRGSVGTLTYELVGDAAEAIYFIKEINDAGAAVGVTAQKIPLLAYKQIGVAAASLADAEPVNAREDLLNRAHVRHLLSCPTVPDLDRLPRQ